MTGRVVLVGAGPGDPELITVRGARELAAADVVVYDRLVAPALLDLVPPEAERIYVGKEPGRAAVPQREIERLLVDRALGGATVVRLKGGDPFVFGRGGEEVAACAFAGIPCEVVPGVSAAVAAPAAAGIPVTHRGMARSFAVVTGSTAHDDEVDLAGRRRRHAGRADGRGSARGDVRRADRGRSSYGRARRDRAMGVDTGTAVRGGNAGGPAAARRSGEHRPPGDARRRRCRGLGIGLDRTGRRIPQSRPASCHAP